MHKLGLSFIRVTVKVTVQVQRRNAFWKHRSGQKSKYNYYTASLRPQWQFNSKNVKLKVKLRRVELLMKLPLRTTRCHLPYVISSHSFACYPTQVNTPRFNPSQTGWYSIYLPRRDGRLSWLKWLVTYCHGRWSPQTVGSVGLGLAWARDRASAVDWRDRDVSGQRTLFLFLYFSLLFWLYMVYSIAPFICAAWPYLLSY